MACKMAILATKTTVNTIQYQAQSSTNSQRSVLSTSQKFEWQNETYLVKDSYEEKKRKSKLSC